MLQTKASLPTLYLARGWQWDLCYITFCLCARLVQYLCHIHCLCAKKKKKKRRKIQCTWKCSWSKTVPSIVQSQKCRLESLADECNTPNNVLGVAHETSRTPEQKYLKNVQEIPPEDSCCQVMWGGHAESVLLSNDTRLLEPFKTSLHPTTSNVGSVVPMLVFSDRFFSPQVRNEWSWLCHLWKIQHWWPPNAAPPPAAHFQLEPASVQPLNLPIANQSL